MNDTQFTAFPFRSSNGNILVPDDGAAEKSFIPTKGIEKVIVAEIEVPPPPPTFSEAELAAAREEGYAHGFTEGEQKGKAVVNAKQAEIDQTIIGLIPSIAKAVKTSAGHYAAFVKEQKEIAPKLALACAEKLYGSFDDATIQQQLEARVIECLEQLMGEPEVLIFVHPDMSDALEARLAEHFAQSPEPGELVIHKDPALTKADCRIEWRHGGMAYTYGQVSKALQEIIAETSEHPAPQASDAELQEILGDQHINDAVSDAIAQQLAAHDIPPIPDDPGHADPSTAPHKQPDTNPAGDAS